LLSKVIKATVEEISIKASHSSESTAESTVKASIAKATIEATAKAKVLELLLLLHCVLRTSTLLIALGLSTLDTHATMERIEGEEVIFIIEEFSKGISSSKEVLKDVLCMLECEEISLIKPSE
jgi:hypothetical protein